MKSSHDFDYYREIAARERSKAGRILYLVPASWVVVAFAAFLVLVDAPGTPPGSEAGPAGVTPGATSQLASGDPSASPALAALGESSGAGQPAVQAP